MSISSGRHLHQVRRRVWSASQSMALPSLAYLCLVSLSEVGCVFRTAADCPTRLSVKPSFKAPPQQQSGQKRQKTPKKKKKKMEQETKKQASLLQLLLVFLCFFTKSVTPIPNAGTTIVKIVPILRCSL